MKNRMIEPGVMSLMNGHFVPALSGSLSGVAAGADVWAFRKASGRPLSVARIRVAAWCDDDFASPQSIAFAVYKVTSFSAIHSGGTGIKTISSTRKFTTTSEALDGFECRMAAAAAITTATYVEPDADEPILVAAGPASTTPTASESREFGAYELPLVLADNEGLIVRPLVTLGAGGTAQLFVGLEVARD